MAKKAGLGQQLYAGGYDLSGDTRSFRLSSPRTTFPATGINKSAMERLIGRTDGLIDFDAFFNDASEAQHDMMNNLPTADVIAIFAQGETAQDQAAGLVAKQANYDVERPGDGSLSCNARLLGQGVPLEWGLMLTSGKDTHASTNASSSVDDSAGTSNGISAYLQIFDIDSGTPTVVIEESSDNGAGDAWASLLSFTAVTAGSDPTAERKTASGSVERYLRAGSTGTFTNLDFAVCYRRGTADDVPGLI